MTRAFLYATLVIGSLCLPTALRAANEGQDDLDKATELQLKAMSLMDLERVCDLCESAISKGLDDDGKKFATQLLTSTLQEHANKLSGAIFDLDKVFSRKQAHPQWAIIRKMAIKDLEKVITLDEKTASPHILLARLYALPEGDPEKAKAAADKAVELSKEKAEQNAMALVIRGSLQKEQEKQLADYEAAINVAPDYVEARRARGLFHLLKKEYEKASADFVKVLEKNPNDPDAINELAESLTSEKKYKEALEMIEKIITADPKSSAGYAARARIKVLQEDKDGALADLNKAVELNRRDVAPLLMRARYYYQYKELDKAKADVDLALRLRPGMVAAILMQAELAAQKGNYEEALENMRMMAAADPMNAIWKLQMAQLLSADKRPRAAIEIANQILKEENDNTQALRIRGDSYLSIGKHAEAVADLEAALKLDPKNSGVLNNLAWVMATSPDDAVRNGKRAIELATQACEITENKRPHIISTLAAAYAEAGDFDNAIKWSTKAVELSTMMAGEDKPDEETLTQLKKELEGYKEKKPFREKQETEEKKPGQKKPNEDLET